MKKTVKYNTLRMIRLDCCLRYAKTQDIASDCVIYGDTNYTSMIRLHRKTMAYRSLMVRMAG